MNIQEMHSTFRVLGQQMGLQLVRGILPESIDTYINDAIVEKVHNEIISGVHTSLQETVHLQAQTMSPINLLRSLFRHVRYAVGDTADPSTILQYYNSDNGYTELLIPTVNTEVTIGVGEYKINPMMYNAISVEYDDNSRGYPTTCRIISADNLGTTMSDYCSAAEKKSPIVVLRSYPKVNDSMESDSTNASEYFSFYSNTKELKIKYLNIDYVKNPNVVKFDLDVSKCVNCDLPTYVHYNIVELAVQKYYMSVGATSGNNQRQNNNQ